MTDIGVWILSGLLVLVYAHGRFRTPRSNIGSTTAFRFRLAEWSYYVSAILFFCALSAVLKSSPGFLKVLQSLGSPGAANDTLESISGPLLAALLITSLLPNFPILSTIDQWLLELFRDIGNIPREVRFWRDRLANSDPVIPQAVRNALKKKVTEEPRFAVIEDTDLVFDPDDSPKYHFTKVVYLMKILEDFSISSRRYPRVLEDFAEDLVSTKTRFEHVIASAGRCFAALDVASTGTSATEPVVELRRSFREKCQQVYSDMCQLLARGVLINELTRRDRQVKLQALGFPYIEERIIRLKAGHVLTVATVVFLALLGGAIAFGGGMAPEQTLIMCTMVAVIYGCATVCALAPKCAWRFADIEQQDDRPVVAYLVSGVLGVVCALAVSILVKSFLLGGFHAAIANLQVSYPWLLMTFVATVSLATLADDWGGRAEREPRWARVAEAIAVGGLLGVTFCIVRWLLGSMPEAKSPPQEMAFVSVAIGLFLGAFVPHWFRQARDAARRDPTGPTPVAGIGQLSMVASA